jgi:hypothetical protein
MKNRPVGVELFRANGQMDTHTHTHDEANRRFSQFWDRA